MRWRSCFAAVLACALTLFLAVSVARSDAQMADDPRGSRTTQLAIRHEIRRRADAYKEAVDRAAALEVKSRFAAEMARVLQRGRVAGDKIFEEAEKNRRDAEADLAAARRAVNAASSDLSDIVNRLDGSIEPSFGDVRAFTFPMVSELTAARKSRAEAEARTREAKAQQDRIGSLVKALSDAEGAVAKARENLAAGGALPPNDLQSLKTALTAEEAKRDKALQGLKLEVEALRTQTPGLPAIPSNSEPSPGAPEPSPVNPEPSPGAPQPSLSSPDPSPDAPRTPQGPEDSVVHRTYFHGKKLKHGAPSPLPSISEPMIVEPLPDQIPIEHEHWGSVTFPVEGEMVPEMMGEHVAESTPHPPVPLPVMAPPRILPARPDYFAPRELPADDSAALWVLTSAKTRVSSIPRPGEADPLNTADALGSASGRPTTPVESPPGETRAVVFDGPAFFPLTKFQDINTAFDSDGLRINEQMVLRFAEDGSYEVEFTAVAVGIPTTLNLQFEVFFGARRGSITLPPITLDPRAIDVDDDDANSWRIVHRGNSSMLRQIFERDGLPLEVKRRGVARFGSGVRTVQPYSR